MDTILFHTCCAPCFIAPYNHLKDTYNITALWLNHNIHPAQEYIKRRDTLQDFCAKESIKLILKDEYDISAFIRNAAYRESNRCYSCYYERLKNTAFIAKKGNFSYFTTSLLYSKFQKHDLIKEIGESISKELSIPFLYQDFREYWKEGITLSKEYPMYRQQYCGCIYSEQDRYWQPKLKTGV
ncbi:MAG TPA: epoxyqueuosine reductase QueH [Candidatus Cloacimonadota bacterium]|nr:epoxyqueuosine reductase QueH [Candidatus Cloacimonadota bacterium]HOQ80566.1 epoxyqueuosine reductase QueH [Candidatus Cloacimonadota bacterium]